VNFGKRSKDGRIIILILIGIFSFFCLQVEFAKIPTATDTNGECL